MRKRWIALLLVPFALAGCLTITGDLVLGDMTVKCSVKQLGAMGDGETDDTDAFLRALEMVEARGGAVVVPPGEYRIEGHLAIPADVTLEGTWRAPARHKDSKGSTLLAYAGKGDADGEPFITLAECSTLKGLVIHYPEQVDENPPIPYPWCVRGQGDNCTILDVLMTNPYQAVDFGTFPCGRHYINRLYLQALYRGVFVDKCFDVGRIENVHVWPFWSTEGPARTFTRENGTAFIFGRTDWEFVTNSFCIGYNAGFLFKEFNDGPGNVLVTQSGSDLGPCAVRVVNVQGHSGITFANCQMMAGVEILPSNTGPVKFTATGFWPIETTDSHAKLSGTGHVFFESCHFSDWDRQSTGAACIQAGCEGLTITGCDFMARGKKQVALGPDVKAAIITSNRLRGGRSIENCSAGDVRVEANAEL